MYTLIVAASLLTIVAMSVFALFLRRVAIDAGTRKTRLLRANGRLSELEGLLHSLSALSEQMHARLSASSVSTEVRDELQSAWIAARNAIDCAQQGSIPIADAKKLVEEVQDIVSDLELIDRALENTNENDYRDAEDVHAELGI